MPCGLLPAGAEGSGVRKSRGEMSGGADCDAWDGPHGEKSTWLDEAKERGFYGDECRDGTGEAFWVFGEAIRLWGFVRDEMLRAKELGYEMAVW